MASARIGGANTTGGTKAATDSTGVPYIAGTTSSANVSADILLGRRSGRDVFVIRYDSNLVASSYSTVIGGTGDETLTALFVDANGFAYVAGTTTSTDFPVAAGAYKSPSRGAKNGFIVKLDRNGSLIYAALIGGSGETVINGIAVDPAGNVFVTGSTSAFDFPTTGGAIQRAYGGGYNDAFFSKLNSAGSALMYSTFVGGIGNDQSSGIAVDSAGLAYITGWTDSGNYPLRNALQSAVLRNGNAFVTKVDANASKIVASTFLGGSGPDLPTSIAVDSLGRVVISGSTVSYDFPVTSGSGTARGYDGFLMVLDGSLGAINYACLFGGSGDDGMDAMSLDAAGNIWVAGHTNSPDLPLVAAIQGALGSLNDGFVALFDSGGSQPVFLSYLGGNGNDGVSGVSAGIGAAFVTGSTLSGNFPFGTSAPLTSSQAFVLKLSARLPPTILSVTPSSGSGTSRTFSFDFTDPAGVTNLDNVRVVFNSSLNGNNACFAQVNLGTGVAYLFQDNAGFMLGPANLGVAATLRNSQCTIDLVNSSISVSVTKITLTLAIQFASTFTGPRFIFAQAGNKLGLLADWKPLGSWSVSPTAPASPPSIVAVSPSAGTGASASLSFAFSEASGASNLSTLRLLINSSLSGFGGCFLHYDVAAGQLFLFSDSGQSTVGPISPGSGSLANSQCVIDGSGTGLTGSGNNLTLTIKVTFKAGFLGNKALFAQASNQARLVADWKQLGSWLAVGPPPPTLVSVSPSVGAGTSPSLSFVFGDDSGAANISFLRLVINSTLSGFRACFLHYNVGSRELYLFSDSGQDLIGPISPGSGSLTNSQCAIDGSATVVAASGNNLTLTVRFLFNAGFAGSKSVFAQASNLDGQLADWRMLGTWIVQ